jgi:hypothetical protein
VDPQCTFSPGSPFDTQTNRNILTGWTVGGGLEKMIYGNWILRAEYRFSQFGHVNDVLPFAAPGATVGSDFVRYRLSVQTHIATVGLAYKFGSLNRSLRLNFNSTDLITATSTSGTKRTSNWCPAMSAFGGKADIQPIRFYVRF